MGWKTKTGRFEKRTAAAKAKRKGNRRRVVKPKGDIATVHEQTPAQLFTVNSSYNSYNVSLASSTRALNVAKGYQFYRIKRVIIMVKPLADTFVPTQGSGAQASVPYFYWLIDRTRQFQSGFTIDNLKAMGSKPRRLDEKTVVFSYTPSVLTETYDNTAGATQSVQYKMSPWLPCRDPASPSGAFNPSSTDHLGFIWRAEQVIGNATNYMIERRIIYEFKKPATVASVAEGEDPPTEGFDPLPVEKPVEEPPAE